jgi:hypothetical protein
MLLLFSIKLPALILWTETLMLLPYNNSEKGWQYQCKDNIFVGGGSLYNGCSKKWKTMKESAGNLFTMALNI